MEAAHDQKKKRKPLIRWIVAAAVLVAVLIFFRTAPGAAALETVKTGVTDFVEKLFPPKDIPVQVEGETEIIHQEAGGQEPELREDGTVAAPGFAIYYDPERYTMVEEDGVTYIRFVTDAELPPCEVEIRHVPGQLPADAAEAARAELQPIWQSVSEVETTELGPTVSFSGGMEWDSACGNVFFLSDGRDGCFRITARYFVEAAEGHGARFRQMIQTFEIIDP